MTNKRSSLLLLLLSVLAFAAKSADDCATCPRVELERNGKQIVAVKTSPDEVSDVFVIEYLDLQSGELEIFDEDKGLLKVAGKVFWFDSHSKLADGLEPTAHVEAVYNPDRENDSGLPYLVELRPAASEKTGHFDLQRFIIYDPDPYQTLVSFADDARAYGHLALVERAKGLFENVILGTGNAAYVDDEDRFKVKMTDAPDAVTVIQGKSHASGRRLEYDNGSGMAVLGGPVKIERSGKKPLSGEADELVYQLDDKTLTLYGHVVLKQEGRTTKADTAVILEARGYAYLYGQPVNSRGDDGELSGEAVRYNLDSGELLLLKGVKATFNDDGR